MTALLTALALLQAAVAEGQPPREAPSGNAAKALAYLIDAAATPIGRDSTCHGFITGRPRPTLGDLLSSRLGDFESGSNQITGGCDGDHCRVTLTHEGGEEDLSMWEYRFRVSHGRLVPSSLGCFGAG